MAKFPIKYDKSQAVFHFERHIPANATTETAKNPKKKKKRQYSDNAKRFINSILRGCSFRSLHFDENGLILSLPDNCVAKKAELQHITHFEHTAHTNKPIHIWNMCAIFFGILKMKRKNQNDKVENVMRWEDTQPHTLWSIAFSVSSVSSIPLRKEQHAM